MEVHQQGENEEGNSNIPADLSNIKREKDERSLQKKERYISTKMCRKEKRKDKRK